MPNDRTSTFGVELPSQDWAEAAPTPGQAAITLEPEPIELFCVGYGPDDHLEIVKFATVQDSPHEFDSYADILEAVNHGEIDPLLVDRDDVAPMPPHWLD